jgi:predicted Zn-dependent protease
MALLAARSRPVILVVEDLHWIDQTSESYLGSLVESLARAHILLLATYRPGYRPAWMDRSYATQLSLRPLATADSLTVVRSLLPDGADADARARIILEAIAKAGGGIKHALRPLIAQAEIGLRAGRAEDALAAARRVAALAPEMRVFVAEARCIKGEALAMLGRSAEALAVLGDAKAQAAAIGATPPRWRSALALRRVLDRCGRHDEARREVAEARVVLERVSAQLPNPQLRRLFGHSDAWREANTDSPS